MCLCAQDMPQARDKRVGDESAEQPQSKKASKMAASSASATQAVETLLLDAT